MTLDNILYQLKPVEDYWYEFGLGLEISLEALQEMASMCPTAGQRMVEMVDWWLRNHTGRPTWTEIANALRKIVAHDFSVLAAAIENVYQTGKMPVVTPQRL